MDLCAHLDSCSLQAEETWPWIPDYQYSGCDYYNGDRFNEIDWGKEKNV